MGLFSSITDALYGIQDKEDTVTKDYNKWVHLRSRIELEGYHIKGACGVARRMAYYNNALLVNTGVARFPDDHYQEFLNDHIVNKVANPSSPEMVKIFTDASETAGGLKVAHAGFRFVKTIGKTLKDRISKSFEQAGEDVGEDVSQLASSSVGNATTDMAADDVGDQVAGDTLRSVEAAGESAAEDGAEVAAETTEEAVGEATTAGLSSLAGPAIVIGLGIDAIVSAIQSSKEAHKLDDEIKKLRKALDQLEAYMDKLERKKEVIDSVIESQSKNFEKNMRVLNGIQRAQFNYNYKPIVSNEEFLIKSMSEAFNEYKYLNELRVNYFNFVANAKKNGMTPSWKTFLFVTKMTAPKTMSEAHFDGYMKYASSFSGGMQKLQEH